MKTIFIFLMLLSTFAYSQESKDQELQMKQSYAVGQISTGYSFQNENLNLSPQFGYRYYNIYVSTALSIPLTYEPNVPELFINSIGYNIGSLQPFISYSYHTIGKEKESRYKSTLKEFNNGWKFGYGITYYYPSLPISLTLQQQGKETLLSVGMYRAL